MCYAAWFPIRGDAQITNVYITDLLPIFYHRNLLKIHRDENTFCLYHDLFGDGIEFQIFCVDAGWEFNILKLKICSDFRIV